MTNNEKAILSPPIINKYASVAAPIAPSIRDKIEPVLAEPDAHIHRLHRLRPCHLPGRRAGRPTERPPLYGFAPTRTWQPGQQIADQFVIPLPDELSPGEYEVRVEMCTLDGGRLAVAEDGEPAGDYTAVGSLVIELSLGLQPTETRAENIGSVLFESISTRAAAVSAVNSSW